MAAAFVDLHEQQKAINKTQQKDLERENERLKRKRYYDQKQFNFEREKWLDQFTSHMDDNQSKVCQLQKLRLQLTNSDNFSVEEAIALVDNQLADYSDQRSKYIQSQREINRSTRPTTNGKPSKAAIDNRHDKSDTILTQSFKRPKLGSIENMMLQ